MKEIEIANTKLIVLLGLEVIMNVLVITKTKAKEYIDEEVKTKRLNGVERSFICIPHPGILMKKFDRNPWPDKFLNEIAPRIKNVIEEIKKFD